MEKQDIKEAIIEANKEMQVENAVYMPVRYLTIQVAQGGWVLQENNKVMVFNDMGKLIEKLEEIL